MGARLKFRCEGLGCNFPQKKTWKKVAKRPHIMGARGGGGVKE